MLGAAPHPSLQGWGREVPCSELTFGKRDGGERRDMANWEAEKHKQQRTGGKTYSVPSEDVLEGHFLHSDSFPVTHEGQWGTGAPSLSSRRQLGKRQSFREGLRGTILLSCENRQECSKGYLSLSRAVPAGRLHE